MLDVLFPVRIILKLTKIRNMKKYLILLVVLISFISCKKQHHEDMYLTMTGSWVETTQGKDTIVFGTFGSGVIAGPSFYLKRASRVNIGIYDYTIKNDTIYTQWELSSYSGSFPYFFKLDSQNQQIRIGNFYDNNKVRGSVLTFSKIP